MLVARDARRLGTAEEEEGGGGARHGEGYGSIGWVSVGFRTHSSVQHGISASSATTISCAPGASASKTSSAVARASSRAPIVAGGFIGRRGDWGSALCLSKSGCV
eukprot:SAG31_NODE_4091_length_3600_cov_4.531848_3_plen_105_part_00